MAYDAREAIIELIMTSLEAIPGFANVWRDRGVGEPYDVETKVPLLPAVIFLDGKERSTSPSTAGHGLRPGPVPPVPMVFEPQIYVILLPRTTMANEGVAAELAHWRMLVLKAILRNPALMNLLGTEGDIHWTGLSTDMQSGSLCRGEIRFDFAIKYVFNPGDLD
jgi:hypothetical protein